MKNINYGPSTNHALTDTCLLCSGIIVLSSKNVIFHVIRTEKQQKNALYRPSVVLRATRLVSIGMSPNLMVSAIGGSEISR